MLAQDPLDDKGGSSCAAKGLLYPVNNCTYKGALHGRDFGRHQLFECFSCLRTPLAPPYSFPSVVFVLQSFFVPFETASLSNDVS